MSPKDLTNPATRTTAFTQIVNENLPLIHAAAHRQCPDQSDDITQATFLVLLQKAPTLRDSTILPAWLLTVTHNICKDARKRAARRHKHEQKAAAMKPLATPPEEPAEDPTLLAPHLDAALAELAELDRAALILRYLQPQQTPFAEIAAQLHLSEPAAKKRIERALQKIRHHLYLRHHLNFSLNALPLTLAWQIQHAPPIPAHLAATLHNLAAITPSTSLLSLAKPALHSLFWSPAKLAAASLLLIATTVAAIDLRPAHAPTPVAATAPDPSLLAPFTPPGPPEPSPPGFTPVIEFPLPEDSTRHVTFLDLDHGRAFRPPYPLPTPAHPSFGMIDYTPDLLDWMKARSISAVIVSDKYFFNVVHLTVRVDSQASPRAFATAATNEVMTRMSALPPPPAALTPYELNQYYHLPTSEFFKTATGATGIIQFVGPRRDSSYYLQREFFHPFGGIPASIRLRYKRVLP